MIVLPNLTHPFEVTDLTISPMLEEKIQKSYPYIAGFSIVCITISLIARQIGSTFNEYPLIFSLIIGGIPILISQLSNVFSLKFSSDILAAISIVTAVILEEYLAANLVILMLSGGESLERYASGRASQALNAFSKRLPNIVKKIDGDSLSEIEVSKIKVGDKFCFEPHQIAPFDGIVEDGTGGVDESILTGEAFRASKVKGSQIISGSINGEHVLTVKVTATGVDTRYQKILKVMQEAQGKKLQLRRIGDQLGAWYTPVAVLLALFFAYLENSSTTFLSVLVVATPCPLIIAIPVAIIGSISKAAERGILIRDPKILENISKVETVYLDKTGTMTYGEPEITEIIPLDKTADTTKVLQLVGSLEQFSNHPLSKPLLTYIASKSIDLVLPDSCQEKPGLGLIGKFGDDEIVVTSRKKAVAQYGINDLPEKTAGLEIIVVKNGVAVFIVKLKDKVKAGGKEFIEHLRTKHGVKKIAILSGDTEEEVKSLALEVGISDVRGRLSPEDKCEIVKNESLKHTTLFVGDGINDAPALSMASIGVAFGTGSEISTEAASAVIIDGKLDKLDELFHIGKRTRRIALESAVGGMLLSIVGMFLAGFGILNPVSGALTQEVIDVFAVLNALRTCLGSTIDIKDS